MDTLFDDAGPRQIERLISLGYEPVTVRGKRPVTDEWQRGPVTAERIAREREAHLDADNIGLRCGALVGIDIDVRERDRVAAVRNLADDVLGGTLLERVGAKGVLLCYRNCTPVKKITITAAGNDKRIALVEILGTGRQFVAYGVHPDTGRLYDWPNADMGCGEPTQVPLARLTTVTPKMLREFAGRAVDLLTSLGYPDVKITGDIEQDHKPAPAPNGDPLKAETVRNMLRYVDPSADRDTWWRIIAAIHAAPIFGGDDDEEIRHGLAVEWSRGDLHGCAEPRGYVDDRDVETQFDSLPPEDGGINIGTLIDAATAAGYHGAISDRPYPTLWEEAAKQLSADDDCSTEDADWPEPFDLFGRGTILREPELTPDMLPDAVAESAFDEAERIGVSLAAVALPMLAVIASVLHSRVRVQPKVSDHTWTEPAILWAVNVAPVGSAKTAAQNCATRPLQDLDRDFSRNAKLNDNIYKLALGDWKAKRAHRSDALKHGEDWKIAHADDSAEPEPPKARRALVSDVTLEKLAEVLSDNERPLLQKHDELAGLIGSFDCYRRNGGPSKDRAAHLELYEGHSRNFDRVGRGSILVPCWGASLVGNIQPDKLSELAPSLSDDGFLQRTMLYITEKTGRGQDRPPNDAALSRYRDVVLRLARGEPAVGAKPIRLSAEAQIERERVETMAEALAVLPSTPVALRGHLAKWPGLFGRLALVFHSVEGAALSVGIIPMIAGETAVRVRRFMLRFLLPMAVKVYARYFGRNGGATAAQWIAGHVLAHRLASVTRGRIEKYYREIREPADAFERAIQILIDAGWLRPDLGPIERWKVNPKIHERFVAVADAERSRRAEAVRRIADGEARVRKEYGGQSANGRDMPG